MPGVAVVVPTYRRPDALARLLAGLERQTYPRDDWELIVVDDASGGEAADSIDALADASPLRVTVIHGTVNRGQAAARNEGWRATSAPLVAFTDDDCVPGPGWLEAGVALMRASPAVGIAQGRTVRPDTGTGYPYSLRTVVREVLAPSPWFEGCNLFLRREALVAAGGFDERLADSAEDSALGWAVLELGWQRGWAGDAVVEHELSERSWRWHLRARFLEGRILDVAKEHPDIRREFWRPWATRQSNAYFALAAAGVAVSPLRRTALLFSVPYLVWLYRPAERRPSPAGAVRIGVFKASGDAASLAGKMLGWVRTGTFLL